MRIRKTQGGNIYLFIIYVILIQMGRGLNGLLGKFGIEYRYSLQPMYIVHCTSTLYSCCTSSLYSLFYVL